MSEFSGLQIDPRCIKCGRPPASDIPLLEMQNHLYICNKCRLDEEQKGKHIMWAGGLQIEPSLPMNGNMPLTQSLTRTTSNVPKNSLFAILDVPITASVGDIETAIGEKMRILMREASSDEKMLTIERLREWQEALVSDPQFLQKQRDAIQPDRPRGSALLIGNTRVYTAKELLAACEADPNGWRDAEQWFRRGELQHWIRFQLGNRIVANEASKLAHQNTSDFHALNYLLYLLVPDRPFRLYSRNVWQATTSTPAATTPDELAALCDKHWGYAQHHLYAGAMIAWLEHSQGYKGLGEYYNAAIRPYENSQLYRGLGLELVLERVAPRLPRPNLLVTFDGMQDEYFLERWDREIPHRPITLKIKNTTRGYISIALDIVKDTTTTQVIEPDWIYLADAPRASLPQSPLLEPNGSVATPTASRSPVYVHERPETGTTASKEIILDNLAQLKRGKHYERTLRLLEQREYGQPPVVHEYPIVLTTMSYFQGFRGVLWRWGLRGDIPGLLWNGAAGLLLALIISQLLIKSIHLAYNPTNWFQISLAGFLYELQDIPHISFVVITGIITGLCGLFTGWGKGHANYTGKDSARSFRKGAFWYALLFLFVLLFLIDGYKPIGDALQHNSGSNIAAALYSGGGSILICFLIFLIACITTMIRVWTEKWLRTHYRTLLHPIGKD